MKKVSDIVFSGMRLKIREIAEASGISVKSVLEIAEASGISVKSVFFILHEV